MDSDDSYDSAADDDYNPEKDPNPLDAEDRDPDAKPASNKNKRKKKQLTKVKGSSGRYGGIRLESDEEEAGEPGEPTEDEKAAEARAKLEAEAKKKAEMDAMFAELGGGVAAKPNPKKKKPGVGGAKKKKGGAMAFKMPGMSKAHKGTKVATAADAAALNSKAGDQVEVTKTFDFAGEAVVVTKKVDAGSREAKAFAAKQAEAEAPKTGLSNILGLLGKKQKMSTTTKSALDWEGFKEEKGITAELENHNKDGYLEKVGFLKRAELREHELRLQEKDKLDSSRR